MFPSRCDAGSHVCVLLSEEPSWPLHHILSQNLGGRFGEETSHTWGGWLVGLRRYGNWDYTCRSSLCTCKRACEHWKEIFFACFNIKEWRRRRRSSRHTGHCVLPVRRAPDWNLRLVTDESSATSTHTQQSEVCHWFRSGSILLQTCLTHSKEWPTRHTSASRDTAARPAADRRWSPHLKQHLTESLSRDVSALLSFTEWREAGEVSERRSDRGYRPHMTAHTSAGSQKIQYHIVFTVN